MEQEPTTTPEAALPLVDEAAATSQEELSGVEAREYKTLGIRVDNELHAKLSFISQLRESSLQGEIVQAIRTGSRQHNRTRS